MPKICVYLPALGLNSSQHQFRERLRLEMGMPLQPTLGAHVTIKRGTGIRGMSLPDLHARVSTFAREAPLRPIRARILPLAEFPIEDSDETVLHLPLSGMPLSVFVSNVLDFFENELHIERSGFEGQQPHVTLVERLHPAKRDAVMSVANSIEWPSELSFKSIVIAHKESGTWRQYETIRLCDN